MKKIIPYAIMLLIAIYLVIGSTLPVQAASAAPAVEASMSIDTTQADPTDESEDPNNQGTFSFHLPMCPCWECRLMDLRIYFPVYLVLFLIIACSAVFIIISLYTLWKDYRISSHK